MMYGFESEAMGTFGAMASVLWIIVLIDLILVGVWLWKQINKN